MIHDMFFRDAYSQPEYAIDIFRLALDNEAFEVFDWSSLTSEMETVFSKTGKEGRTDLIFSVKTRNKGLTVRMIFMQEHKSYQDPQCYKKMFHHMAGFYSRFQFDCLVVPIIIYHGKEEDWNGPRSFQEALKTVPEELKKHFGKHTFNFHPIFLNIRKLTKKEIQGLVTAPVLHILQNIWSLEENIDEKGVEILRDFFIMGEHLSLEERKILMLKAMNYLRKRLPDHSWKKVKEIEDQEVKEEKMQTLWEFTLEEEREKGIEKGIEKGMEKGIEKGMEKGMEKAALALLKKGMNMTEIAETLGLPLQKVQHLKP